MGSDSQEDKEHMDELLKQYNNLRNGYSGFLEEEAFERIIEHYDEAEELSKALEAADMAIEYFPFSGPLLIKKADLLLATRKVAVARRALVRGGSEALVGSAAVVRGWQGASGQVFANGALWRARLGWSHEDGPPQPGDYVVIERVDGLTLSVRKAEEWEVP